jgi:hypothetical protein
MPWTDKIQIVKNERTSIIYFGDRTRGHTFGSQSFGEGFANTLHGVKEKETSESAMIEMVGLMNKGQRCSYSLSFTSVKLNFLRTGGEENRSPETAPRARAKQND